MKKDYAFPPHILDALERHYASGSSEPLQFETNGGMEMAIIPKAAYTQLLEDALAWRMMMGSQRICTQSIDPDDLVKLLS